MKAAKRLGIWMDHSIAHLTELNNDTIETRTIESKPEVQVNKDDLYYKDESHELNKEQGLLSSYYNKLSAIIVDYDEVLLFGPTDAKNELLNLIKKNHLFDKIKIEVKSVDKMTENQQKAFVNEHFNSQGKGI